MKIIRLAAALLVLPAQGQQEAPFPPGGGRGPGGPAVSEERKIVARFDQNRAVRADDSPAACSRALVRPRPQRASA